MRFRKIVSWFIAVSFIILAVTGVFSFVFRYSRITATIHTFFGILFTVGILCHLSNNLSVLWKYRDRRNNVTVLLVVTLFFLAAYFQSAPLNALMNFGASLKADATQELNLSEYTVVTSGTHKDVVLTIDLLRSTHYWHPQMAIWIEDMKGDFIESLFVTNATAKGLFFGGRSKENFKSFDAENASHGGYRRVDALPIWSHKRGVQYGDGMYVPPREDPLPDGISGATLVDNFKLNLSTDNQPAFVLKLELNVAFDDNEYYSEFDFPDDEVFHSGTGQLGQPSILFEALIDMNDTKDYYLMELVGHGHRSGQSGEVYGDMTTLSTALDIVERIVVGAKRR